jgi:UDP-glucose 4-epimerase
MVTGGAGFLGSHLVERLVREGNNVIVFDDLSSGNLGNLREVIEQVEFAKGDLRDRKLVMEKMKNIEVVYHFGANASVPISVKKPIYDFECNALGTLNVLEACRRNGANKIIYASSAAVYGEPEYIPIDENHPLNPISPYGASKLAGEKLVSAYHEAYDLRFSVLRIFNVYGPRQRRYVMYDFTRKLLQKPKRLGVLGTGEQTRTYCYILDAVDAILLAEKQDNCILNIGGDTPIKIRALAELFVSRFPPKVEIKYTGRSWKGDIQQLIPDTSEIKDLGFRAKIPLNLGIKELIKSFE